jgi:hypothetical protein
VVSPGFSTGGVGERNRRSSEGAQHRSDIYCQHKVPRSFPGRSAEVFEPVQVIAVPNGVSPPAGFVRADALAAAATASARACDRCQQQADCLCHVRTFPCVSPREVALIGWPRREMESEVGRFDHGLGVGSGIVVMKGCF